MGCFDVVCALTNTPIHVGENCHLAILRKDTDYNTLTWIMSSEGRLGVQRVFHGKYNDYGSIEECTTALSKKDEELLDSFQEDDRYHFFVSDIAWKWAQERHAEYIPYEIRERRRYRDEVIAAGGKPTIFMDEDPVQTEHLCQIARLMLSFSLACKHPLAGLGQYHQYDETCVADIRENMALTEKRLQEVEARYAQYAEEFSIEPPQEKK